MATKAEDVSAHLDDGASLGKGEEEASPVQDIETDDSDLGSDFAEMDEDYSKDFDTSDVVEAEASPDEEVVEDAEEEEPEEAPSEEAEVVETPTEEEVVEEEDFKEKYLKLLEETRQKPVEEEPQPSEEERVAEVSDEDFKAAHDRAMEELEKSYALSQEDADRFLSEPEAVVPRTLANMHLNLTYSVMQSIRQALPGWIAAVQGEMERERSEKGAVYEKFPSLKGHEEAVEIAIGQYRRMNPRATQEDIITRGGAMAMVALGLEDAGTPASTKKPVAQPARQPHRPASTRGRASKPTPRVDNEFTEMALDDDAYD